ncbi:Hydrolase, alpha/beta fold family functionally coupled to Phosphoribulokinase [Klebsiella pneumoniae IS46]|nr:Hydrolase, alpha/beta fold family functionally coupled to Phosphoribulokinase [Klebsiella pneumoniae IS46]
MLGCLLAEEGDRCPLDAAVIVSAPFMLEACSYHMDKGLLAGLSALSAQSVKSQRFTQAESVPGLAARRFTPAQRDAPHPGI